MSTPDKMLNVKGNSSSGDMVAKPVSRKRGRPPANTASSVEKRKRQKKKKPINQQQKGLCK